MKCSLLSNVMKIKYEMYLVNNIIKIKNEMY